MLTFNTNYCTYIVEFFIESNERRTKTIQVVQASYILVYSEIPKPLEEKTLGYQYIVKYQRVRLMVSVNKVWVNHLQHRFMFNQQLYPFLYYN